MKKKKTENRCRDGMVEEMIKTIDEKKMQQVKKKKKEKEFCKEKSKLDGKHHVTIVFAEQENGSTELEARARTMKWKERTKKDEEYKEENRKKLTASTGHQDK